jgi:anti-sigma regulatory factor (Ser/Thr protein kinase)
MATTENNEFSSCMNIEFPYSVSIKFPGDLEYIPTVRKFIAELLLISDFSPKFAYRSEIIVDEICNNAVVYGCQTEDAEIELKNQIFDDRIEFTIQDQGGTRDNLIRLRKAADNASENTKEHDKAGLGLEIVRMLSERLDVIIDDDNLTSVHIVRRREGGQDNKTLPTDQELS